MLNDRIRVWDILARWELDRDDYVSKGSPENGQVYIFMLKVRYAYTFDKSDVISTALFFSQSYFD
jgi:hypothetical protein